MLLDQSLNLLAYAAWLIFLLLLGILVIRSFQAGGLRETIRALTTGRVLLSFLLVLILSLLSWSLVFIEPQEVGVVVSLISRNGYREQPMRSGLHMIVPMAENVVKYPISWQTYTMSSEQLEGTKTGDDSIAARSADGQAVNLDSSVIFRLDPNEVTQLHIDFQSRYIDDFIRPVLRGLVRTEVSQFTADEINSSKRKDLEANLDEQLRTVMGEKGLILDRFLLRKITFSALYSQAIEQKQAAEQARVQREYEAEQIRTLAAAERDRLRIEAQGSADATILLGSAAAEVIRLKADAEAEAFRLISLLLEENPKLLTYRYIDKLGPALKALLLPSNNPLLLPVPDFLLSEEGLDGLATPTPSGSVLPDSISPVLPDDIPTPTPTPTATPALP
jgi:regulator of protease activity HflC (stomatin/prohibitin superfamily)